LQSQTILEVKDICKSYDGIPTLNNVSFNLMENEILGIVGHNASSKTTLIKAISGVMRIEKGSVKVRDRDGGLVEVNSVAGSRALGMTVLHEHVNLYDHFTVAENIYFGVYSKTYENGKRPVLPFIKWNRINECAQDLCNSLCFDIDVREKTEQFGTAEKQIISLIHALVLDTRILLIDDAFSALGQAEIEKVIGIIKQLNKSGVSIICLSQTMEYIKDVADSIMVIKDGETGKKIGKDSEEMETVRRMFAPFSDIAPYPKLPIEKGTMHLECNGLKYKNIIKNVSVRLRHGEILGILGAAGSGRTTLARLLCGDLKIDSGNIFIDGEEVNISSTAAAKGKKIFALLDDSTFYGLIPTFDISSNLVFPNYCRRPNGKPRNFVQPKMCDEYAQNAIEKLAIKCNGKNRSIFELSAGNQQKLLLARGLAAKAEIFIFDEPTRAVDTAGKVQIYNLLNELVMNGKSVILLTSDIPEALGMCDRLLVLKKGVSVTELVREVDYSDKEQDGIYEKLYAGTGTL